MSVWLPFNIQFANHHLFIQEGIVEKTVAGLLKHLGVDTLLGSCVGLFCRLWVVWLVQPACEQRLFDSVATILMQNLL